MVVTEPVRIRFCTPGLETRSCEFVWRDLMAVVDLLAYEPSPSSAFSPSPQAFSFPGLGLGRCGRTDGRPAGGRGREAISRAWSVPAHPHFFRIPIRSGPFRAWLISFFWGGFGVFLVLRRPFGFVLFVLVYLVMMVEGTWSFVIDWYSDSDVFFAWFWIGDTIFLFDYFLWFFCRNAIWVFAVITFHPTRWFLILVSERFSRRCVMWFFFVIRFNQRGYICCVFVMWSFVFIQFNYS